jgi:chloramphenicol 3-O phosphotransferase
VSAWHRKVHISGIYDLEVDTAVMSPQECAEIIRRRLAEGLENATAIQRITSASG